MRTILAFLAALSLASCQQSDAPASPSPSGAGFQDEAAGTPMPDIAILAPGGEQVSLREETSGEPVLVNLWASWCAPCIEELPTLVALAERGDVRVMTLNQDMGPQSSVEAFLEGKAIDGVETWQDAEMAMTDALGVQIMPTTILYDAEGVELWRYVGDKDWSGDEAARLIADAL